MAIELHAHAGGGTWRKIKDLYAHAGGGTWRKLTKLYAHEGGGVWRLVHSPIQACDSITSATFAASSNVSCADPKCIACVCWTLGCTCEAGQDIHLARSVAGGSYITVSSTLSCTASSCATCSGTGNYRDSYCTSSNRQYRVEITDTDGTTVLDTAYTQNAGCVAA